MSRTSYISLRSWWSPLCTRPTRYFFSWIFLVLAHWNISLILSQPIFVLSL